MKCIIIDDESTARLILKQLCNNVKDLELVQVFPDAIEAIKFLNKHKVDLVFLDIHMPTFSGMDFVQTLKNPPKVVVTSSDAKFALEAFEYDCIIDYLVKPIFPDRFLKAINKVKKYSQISIKDVPKIQQPIVQKPLDSGNDLYVNIDKRLIKIDMQSIKFIKAKGDYIEIVTDNKNHTVHNTLKSIQNKLPEAQFLKVHRSYIINFKKIIDIEDNSVLIAKDVIPVSRSNRSELMKRLNLL